MKSTLHVSIGGASRVLTFVISLLIACVAPQVAIAAPAKSVAATTTSSDSIYSLEVPLTDQSGRAFTLDSMRGKPALITMFYSGCQFVCPRIVEALRKTETSLPANIRNRVPILMVSFDVKNDTPEVLRAMALERHLDDSIWTLARSDERNTRKLAALLNIQYRELSGGDFNHTSVLILLDADGRIVGRTSVIGKADPAFVKLVAKQMAATSP